MTKITFSRNILIDDISIKLCEFSYVKSLVYEHIDTINNEIKTKKYKLVAKIMGFLLAYATDLLLFLGEPTEKILPLEKKYLKKRLNSDDIFIIIRIIEELVRKILNENESKSLLKR